MTIQNAIFTGFVSPAIVNTLAQSTWVIFETFQTAFWNTSWNGGAEIVFHYLYECRLGDEFGLLGSIHRSDYGEKTSTRTKETISLVSSLYMFETEYVVVKGVNQSFT